MVTAARELGWLEVAEGAWRLVRLSVRISLRRKLPFMALGVLVYYSGIYAIAVFEPFEGFGVREALLLLVDLPGAVLGIYLAMDLVSKERDGETLETLFSTASSHYSIWTVRLLCVLAVLQTTLLVISTVAYFVLAEFPFVLGALNAFVPAFLMASLTFWLSTWARGANTAAMLASAVLTFLLMLAEGLWDTPYWIFMSPFEMPLAGNEVFWAERVFLNRLSIFLLGVMFLFLALRRMEKREKFLS